MALLLWASPIVFARRALNEGQTGLWVQAGLSRSVVKKLIIPRATAAFRYALVAGEGVYRAQDGTGTAWQPVDRDLPSRGWQNVEVQALAADFSDPFVIYAGMGGAGSRDPARSAGLYVTNDGGETWQNPTNSMAGQEVQAIAVMPHTANAEKRGAAEDGTGLVITSSATQLTAPGSVVCAATVGGIYCTTGAGQRWVRLDWRGTERVLSLAIRPDDPQVVYLGTAGFGLAMTKDGGATWMLSSRELQNRQVYDIAISLSTPDVMYVATDAGLFESVDAGSRWAQLDGPMKGRRAYTIALGSDTGAANETATLPTQPAEVESVLYAGLQYGAAYRSADGGRSWVALNKGLGSMTVLSLAVDPHDSSILWAGTTDGVWRYVLPVAQGEPVPSPTATVTSTAVSVSPSPWQSETPKQTVTLTPTALPSATPTTGSTATAIPTPTATYTLQPTVTPTAQISPTTTRTPSPTPTMTATPSPTPVPPGPRPTETRVPR